MCEACKKEILTMCFLGEKWCSDDCRRVVGHLIRGEVTPTS